MLHVEDKTAIGHVSCYCLLGTGAFRAAVIIRRDRDYLHSFCVSKIPLIRIVEGDFAPYSLV